MPGAVVTRLPDRFDGQPRGDIVSHRSMRRQGLPAAGEQEGTRKPAAVLHADGWPIQHRDRASPLPRRSAAHRQPGTDIATSRTLFACDFRLLIQLRKKSCNLTPDECSTHFAPIFLMVRICWKMMCPRLPHDASLFGWYLFPVIRSRIPCYSITGNLASRV